jgi:dienelactone hydrolase
VRSRHADEGRPGRGVRALGHPPRVILCLLNIPAGSAERIRRISRDDCDNDNQLWATMMREYAADLAAKGFTAMIPDYFLTTGTAAGSIDYQRDGAQIVLLNRNTWVSGLSDAETHAKTLAGIDPKRIGLLGFSLGGHLGLHLRSSLKVLVEFFAPVLDGIGPGSPSSQLRVQIHHGKIDAATRTGDLLVPFEANAIPIAHELKREGVSVDVREYLGAGHGFVGTDAANKNAATQSKARTISFFESHL